MNRAMGWGGTCVAGVAALALLTHCGGASTQERAETEEGALPVLRQGVESSMAFIASADAFTDATAPSQNFGSADTLGVDLSPQQRGYLRFDISGLSGKVTRARLWLFVTDGTKDGPKVFSSQNSWSETGLTWNNAPAHSATPLGDLGALSSGRWVDYDVTAAVRGNGPIYFTLVADSSDGADFASRERAQYQPQLVLNLESTVDCQPRTDTQVFDRLASATAYASQAEPTRRFDGTPTVLVDAAPTRLESYLKFGFNLDDGWHPKQVTLRLFATDGSSNGPLLHRASPTWQDFDWNTRPALMGDALANFGAISPGTWVEHDLTSVMTTPNMQYGFALLPDSSDGVDFASATAPVLEQRPHLRVTLESDPYCTYQGGGGGSTGWTKHYGGVGPERLGALATDAQGGFVAAGQFGDAPFPTGEGFALARYDASGTALWSRQVTTQAVTVRALTVTPEGNILAVGTYTGTPDLGMGSLTNAPYFPSLFIAKFSPTGQTVWSRGFVSNTGRTGDDFGYLSVLPESVATDAQGSLVVAGNFYGVVDFGGGPLFAGQASVGLNDAYWGGFVAKFTWRGEHVWSRALEAAVATPTARVRTVSTDAAGNVLLGGRASRLSDLGDGVLGAATPFIAKYTPSGVLVWKRLFSNAPAGEVVSLRATSTGGVAFIADVGGIFVFKDSEFSGGHDDGDPTTPQNTSPFVGALSATGSDAWLRDLYPASVQQLAVGSDDAITVSGHGDMYDLGGGVLGTSNPAGPTAFVVQYTPEGLHRWSRLFDRNFEGGPVYYPVLQLAPQPGGSVLVGTDFSTPVIFDGAMYTPRGSADLFYFQLAP